MSFRIVLLVLFPLLLSLALPESKLAVPAYLLVANQVEHTALVVDLASNTAAAKITVGVNGHELAVSPDRRFAYVPIYGNSGVGKPGTDGRIVDIVDLRTRQCTGHIDLGKPVRPHCARFGPDGLLYVSAELASAIDVVDTRSRKVVAEIPTGQPESHMFVISPDGRRAYTANVGPGTVSVLDIEKRKLVTVIPVSSHVQRISISADGHRVFTHDQDTPRIAVIDTASNKISGWIPLPSTVYTSAPLPGGHRLLAGSPTGKLFVIDLDSLQVAQSLKVHAGLGELLVAPDGAHAYLSCPQAGLIEVFNVKTGELEQPIMLTKGVDGLAWIGAAL